MLVGLAGCPLPCNPGVAGSALPTLGVSPSGRTSMGASLPKVAYVPQAFSSHTSPLEAASLPTNKTDITVRANYAQFAFPGDTWASP